jgi:uncharacterized surface protein with fasciclin (FAS1) repeats
MKIKLPSSFIVLLINLAFCWFTIPACNKPNMPSGITPGGSTITNILENSTNATIFLSLMKRTGLDSILNMPGPFTVFVPVDNAFAASGITDSILNSYSDSAIKQLLLYHTIAAGYLSSNFPSGPNAKLVTANGDSVFVTANSTGVFVNGVTVAASDIIASNGAIDAMSQVLIPSKGSILQTIQADTSFSFLVAAIERASQGSFRIDSMLSSGGPYTLLAPVNNAFRNAGFATTDSINNAIPDTIANIVLYHIIPNRMFTSDINGSTTVTTSNDSTVLFTITSTTPQVLGKQNTYPANTTAVNVMAYNGVIFVIDQVLLP